MRNARTTTKIISLLHMYPFTDNDGHDMRYIVITHITLELGIVVTERRGYILTLLERAVINGRIEHVHLYIKYNADVNSSFGLPIRSAAWDNRNSITTLLIQAGADVNLCGEFIPAIRAALSWSEYDLCKQLITAGAVLPDNALSLAYGSILDRDLKIDLIQRTINKR